jgi:DNA-binding response OmpR family regulator
MPVLCPACGHAIRPLALTIQRNAVAANGLEVRVSPAIATIIARLSRDAPRPVILSAIIGALWGGRREEPDTAENIISVHICLARKQLKLLGYDIEHFRSCYDRHERAYRLVRLQPQ